ncbi:hypothetical protein TIFTF001_017174 [Ficus carica]|uniref:Uncharacterized protein n=1 Tax=Ficus carica TaxID=3494 RepID=A0AA88DIZ5_FICCA|nr:hypothetical protein TIFTF001_017174 [Ficus carica]
MEKGESVYRYIPFLDRIDLIERLKYCWCIIFIIHLTSHYPSHPKSSPSPASIACAPATFPDAGDPPPAPHYRPQPWPAGRRQPPFLSLPLSLSIPLSRSDPPPAPPPPAPAPASRPPATPALSLPLSLSSPLSRGPPPPTSSPPPSLPGASPTPGLGKRERKEKREKGGSPAASQPGLGPVVGGRRWVAGVRGGSPPSVACDGKVTGDGEDFGWEGPGEGGLEWGRRAGWGPGGQGVPGPCGGLSGLGTGLGGPGWVPGVGRSSASVAGGAGKVAGDGKEWGGKVYMR